MRAIIISVAVACAVSTTLFAASRIEAADQVAAGRQLVQDNCGPCHATGRNDVSPHPRVRPLRSIAAAGPNAMLEALRRTGIVAGHDEMPEFEFTDAQATALLTYLDSLVQPPHPGKGNAN